MEIVQTNVRWEHPHTGSIPLVIGWHRADLKTRWGQDLCGDAQQVGNWDVSHRSHFLLTIMISHLLHMTPGESRGQSWWTPGEIGLSSIEVKKKKSFCFPFYKSFYLSFCCTCWQRWLTCFPSIWKVGSRTGKGSKRATDLKLKEKWWREKKKTKVTRNKTVLMSCTTGNH